MRFFFRLYIFACCILPVFLIYLLSYNLRGIGEHIIDKYWKYQYKLAYVARLGDIGIVKKKHLQYDIKYIVFFKYNHFSTFLQPYFNRNHLREIFTF